MNDHLHALPAGHRLGEYRIEYVLGSGGFGITYYAWDTNLDKPVAVKEYLPNEFALRTDATTVRPKSASDERDYQWGLERFLDEARTLARFKHPHLNEVHRFFEANGTAYIVLDYIEGETLSQLLKREGRLDETILGRLMEEMLSGLEEVHGAGFVHRDIKPGNVILRKDGSSVLLDFGAARQAVGQRSKSITSILTPGYAPIEQYDQKAEDVGPWSDLYALGMVAYRCISGLGEGGLPDAVARARLERKGEQDKDLKPALEVGRGRYSESLLKAVDWAIKVDERERPQSVAEIRGVLGGREVAAGNVPAEIEAGAAADTEGRPAVQPGPVGSKSGNRKLRVLILVALLLGAGIGAVGWIVEEEAGHIAEEERNREEEARRVAEAEAQRKREEEAGRIAEEERNREEEARRVAEEERKREEEAGRIAEEERKRFVGIVGREPSPKAVDANGWTDLHTAAAMNAPALAAYLLDAGASVDARLKDDGEAFTDELKNMLREIRSYTGWIRSGETPLHIAAYEDALKVAEYLVGRGADINAKTKRGSTPFHFAAWNDALKVAEYLVGRGADINAKNNYGSTPLHTAAWSDALKVAEYLVGRGADINAKNNDGETPLYIAAGGDALKVAEYLVGRGADINTKTNNGSTPLHTAAWEDALKVAEYLVGRGADINAKTIDGHTPFHFAASNDALKVAEYLVGRGADINAKDKYGRTPLHHAAWNDAPKVAEYLVGRGADINAKNNDGETPLHIAIRKDADEVAAWLRSKGAR